MKGEVTYPTFRLALTTLAATLLLIVVGGYTRGSDSGFGCADRWPLCEDGLLGGLLPRADYHMIVEWSHRWLAGIVGILAIATAIGVWRNHRRNRAIVASSVAAVLTIALQAWIGRAIVTNDLDADLVSLHLAISLTVAALLTVTVVSIRIPRDQGTESDGVWTTLVAAGAGAVLVVIMLGSLVHNLYFPGWPLMFNTLIPELNSWPSAIHFLHRLGAGVYLIIAVVMWRAARRRKRAPVEVLLLGLAAAIYAGNVAIGATHVFTQVDSAGLVALHLGLASSVWVLTVAAAVSSARLVETQRVTSASLDVDNIAR